jgi:cell division protein FtsL
MNATDFEYAIKKDVRNNPIVREVDEARQRQLLRAVGIGALLVAVLLFSAWQHFELVQHGYLMERLQQERAAEEEINRHLKLEIATLRAPRRIEDMAIRQLRMVNPAPAAVVIVERVATPAPPATSIVAAR